MTQELGVTTDKQKNPNEWYTEVVKKADLADYAPVKGCMVIRPWGMKLWKSVKKEFDQKIKDEVDPVYFPMFIPESLLEKEEEIVEGFGLEVAWVQQEQEDQEERIALRPTSESIISDYMSKWIRSHRDLPLRMNQWANIVRWEVSDTRPFLRTREFLWQEGHTAHATDEEAEKEAMKRLEQYREIVEGHLAIPSILGYKPEHDKFPGAKFTTTIETLMPDGKSIQSGTSHNLGQHFAEAFDITYEDKKSEEKTCWTTSWGISTRLIGALIMAHGDNDGLRLPPSIAPTQIVIVPIHQGDNKAEVLEYATEVREELEEEFRVELDDREHRTPGYKFNEWELKGVPLRIEVGPNEVEDREVTAVRRDNGEKKTFSFDAVRAKTDSILDSVQKGLYDELADYLEANVQEADSKEEIMGTIGRSRGYVKTRWCGDEGCEEEVKDEVAAEIVVLPFRENSKPETIQGEENYIEGKCAVCGEKAERWAYFAKNY